MGSGGLIFLWQQATSALPAPIRSQWFEDYVASLDPLCWWRLNEPAGTTSFLDSGRLGFNGTSSGTIGDNVLEGAVQGPSTERARWFNNNNGSIKCEGGNWSPTVSGQLREQLTLGFWVLQGEDFNNVSADVMGHMGGPGGGYGFRVSVHNNAISFTKHSHLGSFTITIPDEFLPNYDGFGSVNQGDYAFYAFTIDSQGVIRAFVNAQEVAASVRSGTPGWVTPPTAFGYSGEFRIGPMGYGNPPQNLALDEIMIFEQTLSRAQLAAIYTLGQYGRGFAGLAKSLTLVGGITGYPLSENQRAEYGESEDITDNVASIKFDFDVTQLVDTGALVLQHGQEDTAFKSLIPNDCILVERKRSDGLTEDAEWETIACMLVEGAPTRAQGPEGADRTEVVLKGVLKLLQIDTPLHEVVEPDTIPMRLLELERVELAPDGAWELRIPRPGVKGLYLDKFVQAPSPDIWASKFRNLIKEPGSDEEYNTSDLEDKILLKGAQNAVQVLPGLGIIRIDPDFYEGPIGYGLGDPDPDGGLKISGERYCSYEDVIPITVTGIYAKAGRWFLEAAGILPIYKSLGDLEIDLPAEPSTRVVYSDTALATDWGYGVVNADSYNGEYYATEEVDQTVEFTSEADCDRLAIRCRLASNAGIMSVQVDGRDDFISRSVPTVAELKLTNPTEYGHLSLPDQTRVICLYRAALNPDAEIMAADQLTPGIHTLTLTCTGEKAASSSDTEVNVTAFMTGQADPTPLARDLGTTLLVDSGNAKGKRFTIRPLSELSTNPNPYGRPAVPSTATEDSTLTPFAALGGTASWTGDLWSTGNRCTQIRDLGFTDGAPSKAAGQANTDAAYTEYLEDDEKAVPLHLKGFQLDSSLSAESAQELIGKITLKIRRLAYRAWVRTSTGVDYPQDVTGASGLSPNIPFSPRYSKWGANGFVSDAWIGLSIDGTPTSKSLARNPTLNVPASSTGFGWLVDWKDYYPAISSSLDQRRPDIEEAVYSGTPAEWGLPADLTMADLYRLGAIIQPKGNCAGSGRPDGTAIDVVARSIAFVESAKLIVEAKSAYGPTTELVLLDEHGAICNPIREGLAAGDSARIGDCGAVEDVIAHHLFKSQFQNTDPDGPLYFDIDSLPTSLQAIVAPQRYTIDNPVSRADVVQSALQSALPNWFLHAYQDGTVKLEAFIQKDVPDVIIDEYRDIAANTSDFGIYTATLIRGSGGYAINIAAGYRAAIRAAKFNHWATTGDTPTGKGINSRDGIAYEPTDAGYAAMNARLRQILDTNNETPQLDGGDWTKAQSIGVLWSAKGSKVGQFTMEDEPLFVLDLGRSSTGLAHLVSQIQISHINTYPWGEGLAQALKFYYLTEEDYMSVYGTLPPDDPDQDDADKAESYFPSPYLGTWKALTDRVPLSNGLTTIRQDAFVSGKPTPLRFLLVKCMQAHYFNGTSNTEDRRARVAISEFAVTTATDVVATMAIGVDGEMATEGGREIMDRLRRRTYVVDTNPYIDSYELGQEQAAAVLSELVRDFAPRAITIQVTDLRKGQTVQYTDPRGVTKIGVVPALSLDAITGVVTARVVDYKAPQSLSGVYD